MSSRTASASQPARASRCCIPSGLASPACSASVQQFFLADDATVARAQDEIAVLASRIAAEYASSNAGWSARIVAAHEELVGASRPALMVLMGAVGFLLLIVCANMANLLLARLSSRTREFAVRAALGASRWEVARPIMAESVLLAVGGGLLGLGAAFAGLRVLANLPEARLPRIEALQVDLGILAFTGVISVIVALAFGTIPALRASRLPYCARWTSSRASSGRPRWIIWRLMEDRMYEPRGLSAASLAACSASTKYFCAVGCRPTS